MFLSDFFSLFIRYSSIAEPFSRGWLDAIPSPGASDISWDEYNARLLGA